MPAPRIIGRYALYGEIAAGGMATVHLGRLLGGGGVSRLVAIKRLHAQFAKDPEFVTMFLDEGRLTARIHHPNVVSILDFIVLEGELFLVMEYVQGEALSSLIKAARKNGEPIPPKITASVTIGMLQGLHAAHCATSEKGEPLHIVHRDVSPQNVLVSVDGVARVLDFGVAKASGRLQTTREGHIKGKIAYMAPEQLRSEPVDRRADIYSSAVVLWELLAGRRLFDGENEGALLTQIVLGKIQPPSAFVPDLPKEWDAVVMKGLAQDPSERYASAEEMSDAIEAIGAVASGRAVGQWLMGLASDSVARRAEVVRQIEQASDTQDIKADVAIASLLTPSAQARANAVAEALTPSAGRDPELTTGATSLPGKALEPPGAERKRSKVSAPVLIGAVGLIALGGVAIAAKVRKDASQAEPTRTAVEAASVATPAPAATQSTALAEPTVAPVASAPPTAWASASAAAAASGAPAAKADLRGQRAAAVPPPPPSAAQPPPKVDCSVPFVIDSNGDRHVKRECL